MDTRVFLIHCGEPSLSRVREALERAEGRDRDWDLVEIAHTTPMDAAFNRMLAGADRRYHVQVDADMELRPHAIQTLRRSLDASADNVWQLCHPLWDTLFRRAIMGVKIYRSEVARRYPYAPRRHCEVDQASRAAADGFETASVSPDLPEQDPGVLGRHLVLDERTAYGNALDRAMRWKWLEQRGQPNWFSWLAPYYHLFIDWYATERDPRFLYGWAGLVAGLAQEIPEKWGEKDQTVSPTGFAQLAAFMAQDRSDWARDRNSREVLPHLGLGELEKRLRRQGEPGFRPAWAVDEPPRSARAQETSRRSLRRLRRGLGALRRRLR